MLLTFSINWNWNDNEHLPTNEWEWRTAKVAHIRRAAVSVFRLSFSLSAHTHTAAHAPPKRGSELQGCQPACGSNVARCAGDT